MFDKSGWHPLHHAANTGSNGIVLRLIDSNIDVNVRTKNMTSASPLHFAVSEGRLMTARILLLNGADVGGIFHEGVCFFFFGLSLSLIFRPFYVAFFFFFAYLFFW